jgi:hypothetical protein
MSDRKLDTRGRLFWVLLGTAIGLSGIGLLFAREHEMRYVGLALFSAFVLFVLVLYAIGREEKETFSD